MNQQEQETLARMPPEVREVVMQMDEANRSDLLRRVAIMHRMEDYDNQCLDARERE